MEDIDQLIRNNAIWAEKMRANDPDFFTRLAKQQHPKYLWIGCADSRVPANQITGLPPGEVFVHRNVANVVQETDFNVLAVLQYAVDVLKVTNIIVCGHYGCGGVQAALDNYRHGLIDNWLAPIRALTRGHSEELAKLEGEKKTDRLCELNVLSQTRHVARTTIIEDAWERGQEIAIHSWIYRLDEGILTPLRDPIRCPKDIGAGSGVISI
ncbi:MAG: carbonate dehydratase [Akkermansiaceae bacterium]|jgi:carbonic anhydrase|nr:carbonate dehydratase [Akkermansiaceae bacterium]MDP4646817.1 carbonate dehydratase [Akkermansiaceae bacterium]MDP4719983.1 carbonate dehydratase [Akkermansiaceae bacterium]MDP4779733.1 carbonate dehydratase [Akkermansiaceae bacterium]MDP4846606.1 carbonate dehydratase [Akkermansiaceae bacterium]